MAYTRGNSKNLIVGAAAIFTTDRQIDPAEENGTTYDSGPADVKGAQIPDFEDHTKYEETLEFATTTSNVGYTSNGLEMTFTPDFGEVSVDQLLDSAKLFKQGMQVTLNTAMAESTLQNLVFAIAGSNSDLHRGVDTTPTNKLANPTDTTGTASATTADAWLELSSGKLGDCPVERGIIAVGPGPGECGVGEIVERIYIAYRALSMDAVTVSIKRDEATVFDVSFRLLPANNGSYGRIIDRVVGNANVVTVPTRTPNTGKPAATTGTDTIKAGS